MINVRYGNGGAVCQPRRHIYRQFLEPMARVAKLVTVLFISAMLAGYINWKGILSVALDGNMPTVLDLVLGPVFTILTALRQS